MKDSKISLAYTRSATYIVERMLRAEPAEAAAYRRAMRWLKPYPSAIIFPETLMLLPYLPGTRRRQVWAVDIVVSPDRQNKPVAVHAKMLRMQYTGFVVRHGFDDYRPMPKCSVPELVTADLTGVSLAIEAKTATDENTRRLLDMYLPRSLLKNCESPEIAYTLDALFSDQEDASRYLADVNRYIWSWDTVPKHTNRYVPVE